MHSGYIYLNRISILTQYVFITGYNASWFDTALLKLLCSDEMLSDKTTNVIFKINLK